MSRPDRRSNDKFYVLDLTYAAKARGIALSASFAGSAAVIAKIVTGLVLPEGLALAFCAPVFARAANYASDKFNQNKINPQDLVLRERRKPRFDF